MTYAKSDFVPGDVIFFEDELTNEKMGEFPSRWELKFGNAEIAMLNGEKCINLIGHTAIMPLMTPSANYLPDEFTVEYDVYCDVSDVTRVICEMRFNDGGAVDLRRIQTISSTNSGNYRHDNPSRTHLRGSAFIGRQYFESKSPGSLTFRGFWHSPDDVAGTGQETVAITPKTWQHIGVSFNKRALKYYVNGVRILNIPNIKKPVSLWLWADNGHTYIRNIRIAKGAVPLYDRMTAAGKIVTYGITFDVGKSTVKPESMTEIMRLVALMKENPDLKFSVEGHTDNTGNAAANQTLSEARSKAVVEKLMENGIARDRLTAAGKGQSSPIADNATDEGRARNRRVEFVKQ
jgi:outer membrane protein OmpA-like peptidoglycan-associated protein